MRRIAWVCAVFLFGALGAAEADETPAAPDEAGIQAVITQQLDALSKEDGAVAESFAAPGIQEKFPSPDGFMGMVKNSYSALIRPRSTHFESLTQTGLGLVQKMTLVDGAGTLWTVAYTMVQVDGQWRISGCFILKSDAVNA